MDVHPAGIHCSTVRDPAGVDVHMAIGIDGGTVRDPAGDVNITEINDGTVNSSAGVDVHRASGIQCDLVCASFICNIICPVGNIYSGKSQSV